MINQIYITIDTDWAVPELIEDTTKLLEEYGIKATFFCTDDFPAIKEEFEIGIHPNFLKKESDPEEIITKLKNNYPQSVGMRGHSLLTSERHIMLSSEKGIKYQSNILMFKEKNIKPYKIFDQIEFPIFCLDDYYLRQKDKQFSIKEFDLEAPGLKIFIFHPIHIFMNTKNICDFEKIKSIYKDYNKLKEKINPTEKGIRNLFIELLEYIKKNNLKTNTLQELNNHLTA